MKRRTPSFEWRPRRGEAHAPSTTLLRKVVPLPRFAGAEGIQIRSRDASGARVFLNTHKRVAPRTNKEGGGAPKGAYLPAAPHSRMLPPENACGRGAGFAKPARLPALHRGSCLATECFGSIRAALHAIEKERALTRAVNRV